MFTHFAAELFMDLRSR